MKEPVKVAAITAAGAAVAGIAGYGAIKAITALGPIARGIGQFIATNVLDKAVKKIPQKVANNNSQLKYNLQFFAETDSKHTEKVLGGRFFEVNRTRGSNEVGHHIAQNKYNRDVGISRNDGPALLMTKDDHALTRTYKGNGAVSMRTDIGLNARQRMVLDIADIRKKFGKKYNSGMLEMIKYSKTLPQYQK